MTANREFFKVGLSLRNALYLLNSLFAVTRPMVLGLGRSVGFFFFFLDRTER